MKITSQSAEELVLTEGGTTGIIVGAVFVIGGPVAWYLFHASNPVVIWIALGMVAIGLLIILMSSSITVRANKTSGQLFYEKKRLTGAQNSTYAIADIFRIETRKQWKIQNTQAPGNQGGNMPQPVLVAQSVIVFKDGRELALDHQKNSSTTTVCGAMIMSGQGAETAIAAQVAKFLNVPFQEIMPPNMSSGTNIIV
jgi:hypothetical protein